MRFACIRCNTEVSVPDTLAGQYVICGQCGAGNDVPRPVVAVSDGSGTAPSPAAGPGVLGYAQPAVADAVSMKLRFRCRGCQVVMAVPHGLVGQYVICWNCSTGNVVPEAGDLPFDGGAGGAKRLECPYCGYALDGLTHNCCPECGRRFDPYLVPATVSEIRRNERSPVVWFAIALGLCVVTPCAVSAVLALLRSLM